jgi:membrane protein YdbS with pleckstrin-like domain
MKRGLSLRVKFVLILIFAFSVIILSQQLFNLKSEPLIIFSTFIFVLLLLYIFIWRILIPLDRYRISIERALRGQYIDIKPMGGGKLLSSVRK